MRLYLGDRCHDLSITSRWIERAVEIHSRLSRCQVNVQNFSMYSAKHMFAPAFGLSAAWRSGAAGCHHGTRQQDVKFSAHLCVQFRRDGLRP